MESMQLQLVEIRDQRQKEWFWIDNEFVDEYAKKVGPVATLVYLSLSRHADQGTQTAFPSMQTIAEEVGIKSRNTIAKGIKKLQQYGIIDTKEAIDPSNGKRLNNVYTLLSRKFWKKDAQPETPKKIVVKAKQEKLIPDNDPEMAEIASHYPWLNKEAWDEWVTYRKEIRKKLTASTVKRQLKELEQHKEDHVEMIANSIRNGWTGIFPIKKTAQRSSQPVAKEGKYSHLSK